MCKKVWRKIKLCCGIAIKILHFNNNCDKFMTGIEKIVKVSYTNCEANRKEDTNEKNNG